MTQPNTNKTEVPITGTAMNVVLEPLTLELNTFESELERVYRLHRFIMKLQERGFVYQYNIDAIKHELKLFKENL